MTRQSSKKLDLTDDVQVLQYMAHKPNALMSRAGDGKKQLKQCHGTSFHQYSSSTPARSAHPPSPRYQCQ
jgi:hypothetical protein